MPSALSRAALAHLQRIRKYSSDVSCAQNCVQSSRLSRAAAAREDQSAAAIRKRHTLKINKDLQTALEVESSGARIDSRGSAIMSRGGRRRRTESACVENADSIMRGCACASTRALCCRWSLSHTMSMNYSYLSSPYLIDCKHHYFIIFIQLLSHRHTVESNKSEGLRGMKLIDW